MRSLVIVDVAPVLEENPGLHDGVEDLAREEFVSRPAVEALDVGVLPGATWLDVGGRRALDAAAVPDGRSD